MHPYPFLYPLRCLRWLLMLSVALLAACQTLPQGAEMHTFTPLPAEKRVMPEVKLRWLVREDVAQYCARTLQMGQEQAYITPPVACAVWDKSTQECTIVTSTKVSHAALGHEVRHCFEGHFHR